MKKKKEKFKGFELIKGTSGIILDGLYIKKNRSELIVSTAWKGNFHFRPISEEEKSL